MKIVSGKLRGRNLLSPKNNLIRPTSNRAKEMIFNTLNSILRKKQKDYSDFSIIDFFCGVGSLGIEAISRGGEKVLFIDNSLEAIKICKKNCANQDILEFSEFLCQDIVKSKFNKPPGVDIFFCDPPYMKYSLHTILKKISNLLKSDSFGVIELPIEQEDNIFTDFELIKNKQISKSKFLFLKKK